MSERVQSPSSISAILGLLVIVGIIIGGLLLLDKIESGDKSPAETLTPSPTITESRVSFVLDGLPTLEEAVYSAWAKLSDQYIKLGSFTILTSGKVAVTPGTNAVDNEMIVANDLTGVETIIVTIEQDETASQPLGPQVLSANMAEGIGALTSPFANYSGQTGEYVLATPTDGPNTNEASGIWLAHRNADGSNSVGMTLPELPDGWEYTLVVTHQDTLLYGGSFSQAEGSDSSSIYSGDIASPAFPGEDFLINKPLAASFDFPFNLADGNSEVTVRITTQEPLVSQVAVNEFKMPVIQYTILKGTIVDGAQINTNYPMSAVSLDLPAGIVVVR